MYWLQTSQIGATLDNTFYVDKMFSLSPSWLVTRAKRFLNLCVKRQSFGRAALTESGGSILENFINGVGSDGKEMTIDTVSRVATMGSAFLHLSMQELPEHDSR